MEYHKSYCPCKYCGKSNKSIQSLLLYRFINLASDEVSRSQKQAKKIKTVYYGNGPHSPPSMLHTPLWRTYNFASTSMQRHYFNATSHQRRFNVLTFFQRCVPAGQCPVRVNFNDLTHAAYLTTTYIKCLLFLNSAKYFSCLPFILSAMWARTDTYAYICRQCRYR